MSVTFSLPTVYFTFLIALRRITSPPPGQRSYLPLTKSSLNQGWLREQIRHSRFRIVMQTLKIAGEKECESSALLRLYSHFCHRDHLDLPGSCLFHAWWLDLPCKLICSPSPFEKFLFVVNWLGLLSVACKWIALSGTRSKHEKSFKAFRGENREGRVRERAPPVKERLAPCQFHRQICVYWLDPKMKASLKMINPWKDKTDIMPLEKIIQTLLSEKEVNECMPTESSHWCFRK